MRSLATDHFVYKKNHQKPASFINLIRTGLSDRDWQQLHPDIKNRLRLPAHTNTLRYIGVMQRIYCSPIGKLFARILRPLTLLPEQCRTNTQFDFLIKQQNNGILKQRRYFLDSCRPFTFRSIFRHLPILHEEFKAGFGMNLELSSDREGLIFRDAGYYIRLGKLRIPIPRWLSVGQFELIHRNINPKRFQVLIRIGHPLFGTLFYQRGEFQKF